MAKITDPNIIAHSKELEVLLFSKKDIEKLAFDVLADLGDEVINKAIEEGKISLPQNIDVNKIPHYDLTQPIPVNDFIRNVAFLDTNENVVYYPLNSVESDESELFYLGIFEPDGSCAINIIGFYIHIDKYFMEYFVERLSLNEIGKTTLYKHDLTVTDGDSVYNYIFITTQSSAITNLSKFEIFINSRIMLQGWAKLAVDGETPNIDYGMILLYEDVKNGCDWTFYYFSNATLGTPDFYHDYTEASFEDDVTEL